MTNNYVQQIKYLMYTRKLEILLKRGQDQNDNISSKKIFSEGKAVQLYIKQHEPK